ncbi:hypothetical protein Hanom_Chr13g01199891 [Helianthus anomalus]
MFGSRLFSVQGLILILAWVSVQVTQEAGESTGAVESTRLNRVKSARDRVNSLVQSNNWSAGFGSIQDNSMVRVSRFGSDTKRFESTRSDRVNSVNPGQLSGQTSQQQSTAGQRLIQVLVKF